MIAIAVTVLCLVAIGSVCPAVEAQRAGVCKDQYDTSTCQYFKRMKLCFVVQESCNKTCDHCACEDHAGLDCAFYERNGLCVFVKTYCKRTCKHCIPSKPTVPPTKKPSTKPPSACKDLPGYDCVDYKREGWCDYFQTECKKTCGNCTTGKVSTKRPPMPPTTRPKSRPPMPTTTKPKSSPPGGSCGRSAVQQSRIIAGVDAKKGAWPWIASMTLKSADTGNHFHFCGGSLIHPKWVLTAAHCVDFIAKNDTKKMNSFQIGLGVHNRSDMESSVQYIGVKDFHIHHTWSDRNTKGWHDVALVELKTPALLSKRVQTVCLPGKNQKPKKNAVCYLAGWGTVTHPGVSPEVLQQAYMPVVSESHCFQANHMICTGYGNSSKTNACRGDSGGPLMCRNTDSSWTVHGIASFVVEYCKYYTAFADVGAYLDWIKKFVQV